MSWQTAKHAGFSLSEKHHTTENAIFLQQYSRHSKGIPEIWGVLRAVYNVLQQN